MKKISKFVFTEKTFRLKRLNSFHDFFSETKRRDTIKVGLEDLQRVLPQFGTPEEEKVFIFCNFFFFKKLIIFILYSSTYIRSAKPQYCQRQPNILNLLSKLKMIVLQVLNHCKKALKT